MSEYVYNYPRPCITADCIVTWKHQILLVRRKNDPFKDMLALPGGYFDCENDESIHDAACRELKEETSVIVHYMDFFWFYDTIGRDPRDRVVTMVYSKDYSTYLQRPSAEAKDDAVDVVWFNIENLWETNLAFDHKKILKDFFNVKVQNE